MSLRPGRRACALVVVLALLIGATVGGPSALRGCGECPVNCPMHARRVSCHHAAAPKCHQGQKLPGLRAGCHRVEAATPAGALIAVLPATRPSVALAVAEANAIAPHVPASRPGPEPVSPPPRAVGV